MCGAGERLPLLTGVRLCAALPVLSSYGRDSVYIHALLLCCATKDSIHTSQRNIHLRQSEACLSARADPESARLPRITKGRLKRAAGASLLCFREGRMGIHHSACSATSQGFPPSVNLGMMPSRSVGFCESSGWSETQSCSSVLF